MSTELIIIVILSSIHYKYENDDFQFRTNHDGKLLRWLYYED